jgi:chromate reductase
MTADAIKVGYLVGSTSSVSINRKMLNGMLMIERERDVGEERPMEFTDIPIDQLPLYNHDADDDYPAEALRLKATIAASDAIIIATPEYNRSIPGALKNAIDWASRPYGENSFAGKPIGIVGASVGAAGTAMAQQHLRNILAYLDAPALAQPEIYVQFTSERFADDGTILDPETGELLGDWLTAFREWVGRVGS